MNTVKLKKDTKNHLSEFKHSCCLNTLDETISFLLHNFDNNGDNPNDSGLNCSDNIVQSMEMSDDELDSMSSEDYCWEKEEQFHVEFKRTVDVASSFGFECKNCSNHIKAPRKGVRRATKSVTELSPEYRKKRVLDFTTVFTLLLMNCGQELNQVLKYFFYYLSNNLFDIVFGLKDRQKIHSWLQNLKDDSKRWQPLLNSCVDLKNKHLISDSTYHELRIGLGLRHYMPSLDRVSEHEKIITNEMEDDLDAMITDEFIAIDPTKAIEYITRIERGEGELPSELKIKISLDGSKFHGGSSILTLTPLNLSSFPTQETSSTIPLAIWYGKEEQVTHFSESVFERLKTCAREANVYGYNSIKFIWVSYLKGLNSVLDGSLYSTCDAFCPFCFCPKSERGNLDENWSKRNISVYGMHLIIGMDSLHCIENLTRRLLFLATGGGDESMVRKVTERIRTIKGFNHFVFPQYNIEEDDNDLLDNRPFSVGRITVVKCKKILENYNIFRDILDEDELLLWKGFKILTFNLLEMKVDELKNRDIKHFQDLATSWCRLFQKRYADFYVWILFSYHSSPPI